MRRIRIFTILFATLLSGLLLPSCGDEFLEPENIQTEQVDNFLNTKEDLFEILNSAYRGLAEGGFMGGTVQITTDLMADDADASLIANADWLKHYNRRTDIFTSTTRNMMQTGGTVTNRVNQVMAFMDQFELTEDERKRLEGESRFLRAIGHFELLRLFTLPFGYTPDNSHPGMSYYTTTDWGAQPRLTVRGSYDSILNDLNRAVELLPEENGNYANQYAAHGYLAKVYFQMNDFEKALFHANEVIGSGRYQLDTLKGRFNLSGSPEAVFSLINTTGDPAFDFNAAGELYNAWNPINTNPLLLDDGFFVEESASDTTRGRLFYSGNNLIKFQNEANRIQLPLVHLTELLLIRAECLAETGGDLQQARDDLSEILVRSGQPPVAQASGAEEIIRITRRERRYELAGEGNRFHELKRIAVLEDPDLIIRGALWDCPGMICQFPDNELAGNPDLSPNPEGGCD